MPLSVLSDYWYSDGYLLNTDASIFTGGRTTMDLKIERCDEGYELTLGGKIYVFQRLSQVLARIEKAAEALGADQA